MGARRRCCCQSGCWFFYDAFNRDDSTDLGGDWHEETGDWGIVGWQLVENVATAGGTADALLITTQAEPVASAGEQVLTVEVYSAVTNDVFYLYPACTDIHTHGPVQVIFTSISNMFRWRVEIGAESLEFAVTPQDGAVTLVACVDHSIGMCKAWVNPGVNEQVWADTTDPGTGRYSGVGHNNVAASANPGAIMDDYFVSELYTSTGIACQDCYCRCRANAPTKNLVLTVFDATQRASCVGGATGAMVWEWNAGDDRWTGHIHATGENAIEHTLIFYLGCESEDLSAAECQNFVLRRPVGSNCCVANPALCTAARPTAASTCDPFYLVFGPYSLTWGDLACTLCYNPMALPESGSYYVAITE
jgi:hypothetical protein